MARWIIAAVVVLGMSLAALGNGAKFPQVGFAKMPEIPQQRALIAYKDGIETLVVESAYVTDSPEVGWVLPVPAEPLEISVADRDVLKSVAMCMRPEVVHDLGQGLTGAWMFLAIVGTICLAVIFAGPGQRDSTIVKVAVAIGAIVLYVSITMPALNAGGPAQGQAGVSALSVQRVGNYQVAVLKCTSAEGLQSWLKTQRLAAIPAAGVPVVDDYAKQGWVFLVAKLTRQGDGAAAAHPLAVKFATKQAVFPMRLTALAGTTTQVDLFVAAAGQAASPGFTRNSVDRYQAVAEGPGGGAVVAAHYRGEKTGLVIGSPEAAKWLWPNCVVTHLSANLQPADMDKDVRLSMDSMARAHHQTVYSEQGRRQSVLVDLAMGGGLIAIATAITCKYRRRPSKKGMVAVGIVVVAAMGWSGYDWLRYPVVPLVMDPDNPGWVLGSSRRELLGRSEDIKDALAKALAEPTTRHAQIRDSIAEAIAGKYARWWAVNPLSGKLMTEERTPGNYAVREFAGKPMLCLYDLEGRELRIEVGQKAPN